MDGLFIDSEPDWHAAETEMMQGYGYDWQPSDQLQCLGGPLSRVTEYMSSCLIGAVEPEVLGKEIIDEMNQIKNNVTFQKKDFFINNEKENSLENNDKLSNNLDNDPKCGLETDFDNNIKDGDEEDVDHDPLTADRSLNSCDLSNLLRLSAETRHL
jgi:hypothetical protein